MWSALLGGVSARRRSGPPPWVWEGGSRCGFHSELRDSASENETPDIVGSRWYAMVSETRVRGNSPQKINEEEWEVEWRGK